MTMQPYFDPLRPHRTTHEIAYEFTHGLQTLMACRLTDMAFVREISVGPRPDCHATTCCGRYVYIACEDGLYAVDTDSLEVVAHLCCGHVYGTNMLPDGLSMLLHDAHGGILLVRGVDAPGTPGALQVERRLDALGTNVFPDTLGGKGDFLPGGRYVCCGWSEPRLFCIETEQDFAFSTLTDRDERLFRSDDLVLGEDGRYAFCACYGEAGTVAVVDTQSGQVVRMLGSGRGTCGMTSLARRRWAVASNDGECSITLVDTQSQSVAGHCRCADLFAQLGIAGTLQGISAGRDDEVYVYDCSGNGALVCFRPLDAHPTVTVSSRQGTVSGPLRSRALQNCKGGTA